MRAAMNFTNILCPAESAVSMTGSQILLDLPRALSFVILSLPGKGPLNNEQESLYSLLSGRTSDNIRMYGMTAATTKSCGFKHVNN